jgi:CubicO group peptidase (beta-lactamase class C family)
MADHEDVPQSVNRRLVTVRCWSSILTMGDVVHSAGFVAAGFEPVRVAFEENFARRGDVGAACAVYAEGRLVVDLWGGVMAAADGSPYTDRTLQMVASATKGAVAICALRLVERGLLDLDEPVATYWPEFAAEGKGRIPVRWLLTHQAGLPYVDQVVTVADMAAWTPVAGALAAQQPVWTPGHGHGYHALTYGWLVGEVIARISGTSPGAFFATEVVRPLGLDLYIGLPDSEISRVAPLIAARRSEAAVPDAFTQRLIDPNSLAYKAFLIPSGLFSIINDPALWQAEVPAGNGIGTARALARMYAACLGEVDGVRLLQPDTLAAAIVEQAGGEDLVTGYQTRYGLGFQLPFPFRPMAGAGSFGHYGLGGSVGFASTDLNFSFGYTVNQMGAPTPSDPRSNALIGAVLAILR